MHWLSVVKHAAYSSALNMLQIRNADPYKGPWGGKSCRDSVVQADRNCDCTAGHCEASLRYIDEVKDTLACCTPTNNMGPFFAESIQVCVYA